MAGFAKKVSARTHGGGAVRAAWVALSVVIGCPVVVGQLVPPTPPSVLPPSDYGHQFVTIGAAGNRAALASERIHNFGYPNLGAVGYEYRMARTEITVAQHLALVHAYAPFFEADNPGQTIAPEFTGTYIHRASLNPAAPPVYLLVDPALANVATNMTWRMAARYCNWLHNGMPIGPGLTQDAFEQGAYDTSTFTQNPNGTYNDQLTRSEGALFWIPSLDEWTKAAHYDPDRYGEGQEGYWKNQAGQDTRLTPGAPGLGQSNWGTDLLVDVGSYPDVQSPWGLLDTSGGKTELTEEALFILPGGLHSRVVRGTDHRDNWLLDHIDYAAFGVFPDINNGGVGLRLASSVPSPGPVGALAFGFLFLRTRRWRDGRS